MDCINLGFRVLPGRLCTGNEDFYKLSAQIITFHLSARLWKEETDKELRLDIKIYPSSRWFYENPTTQERWIFTYKLIEQM